MMACSLGDNLRRDDNDGFNLRLEDWERNQHPLSRK